MSEPFFPDLQAAVLDAMTQRNRAALESATLRFQVAIQAMGRVTPVGASRVAVFESLLAVFDAQIHGSADAATQATVALVGAIKALPSVDPAEVDEGGWLEPSLALNVARHLRAASPSAARRLLAQAKAHPECLFQLGAWQLADQIGDAAARTFQRWIERYRQTPEALGNLAIAQILNGQFDAAIDAAQAGLRIAPRQPVLEFLRADALLKAGRFDEAEVACKDAQAAGFQDVARLREFSMSLAAGRGDEAEAETQAWALFFDRETAIELVASALTRLAGLRVIRQPPDDRSWDTMLDHWDQHPAVTPGYFLARARFASQKRRSATQALAYLDRAIELAALRGQWLPDEVWIQRFDAARKIADWGQYERDVQRSAEAFRRLAKSTDHSAQARGIHGDARVFTALGHPWLGAQDLLALARQQSAGVKGAWPRPQQGVEGDRGVNGASGGAPRAIARDIDVSPGALLPDTARSKRLRVGFFSGALRQHATGYLLAPVFEQLQRVAPDVHWSVFDFGPEGTHDPVRERLRRAVDQWVCCAGDDDAAIVERIREASLDVLVDLDGWANEVRPEVLASRPAPIQVMYLGFPGSVAAPWIDALIADHVVLPPELREHVAESVLYLPETYFPLDRNEAIMLDAVARERLRASLGFTAQDVVLASFNAVYKWSPEGFEDWLRIMAAVPESRLWLGLPSEKSEAAAVRETLTARCAAAGLASERLIFAERADRRAHLERLVAADLLLDSSPYGGHTTTVDGALAGVPTLTRLGATWPGRVAAALMQALGLDTLVTADRDEFVARGIALGADRTGLIELRETLRHNLRQRPVGDIERFTRDFASLLRQVAEVS
ncbi:MAG: hypothetical protein ACK4IT_05795 [Thioalkalivibrionaceae bacterium]